MQTQKSFWQTPTSNQKAFKLSAESDPLTDCKAKWILIRQFLSCRNKPSDINLKPPNNFCEVKKFLATRLLGYTTISRSAFKRILGPLSKICHFRGHFRKIARKGNFPQDFKKYKIILVGDLRAEQFSNKIDQFYLPNFENSEIDENAKCFLLFVILRTIPFHRV